MKSKLIKFLQRNKMRYSNRKKKKDVVPPKVKCPIAEYTNEAMSRNAKGLPNSMCCERCTDIRTAYILNCPLLKDKCGAKIIIK